MFLLPFQGYIYIFFFPGVAGRHRQGSVPEGAWNLYRCTCEYTQARNISDLLQLYSWLNLPTATFLLYPYSLCTVGRTWGVGWWAARMNVLQSLLSNNRKNKERESEGRRKKKRKVKKGGKKEGTKFQRTRWDGSFPVEFMFQRTYCWINSSLKQDVPASTCWPFWRKLPLPTCFLQPSRGMLSSVGLEWRCYRL